MAETVSTPSSQAYQSNFRALTGRILMAVIIGEAVWHLIVSIMDNVVVPWLGDAVGPGSSLPTSFTQRPYDYPDLFIAILAACIAGIVAISINWFLQRPVKSRVQVRTSTSMASQPTTSILPPLISQPTEAVATVPPPPASLPEQTAQAARVVPPPQSTPPSTLTPPPVQVKPAEVPPPPVTSAPVAVKPAPPPTPKPQPVKKKEVYYNIVGDPVSDDD